MHPPSPARTPPAAPAPLQQIAIALRAHRTNPVIAQRVSRCVLVRLVEVTVFDQYFSLICLGILLLWRLPVVACSGLGFSKHKQGTLHSTHLPLKKHVVVG